MQSFRSHTISATALLVALAACSPAADNGTAGVTAAGVTNSAATPAAPASDADVASVRATIEAANQALTASMLKGDAAAATAHYAEDAIAMQPGMPAMRGRAAIQQGFQGMMGAMTIKAATFTIDDVMVGGDMAVETGHYTMTQQPTGGKAMDDAGKYIAVWKRQSDGSWKIVRDVNNSDAGAPTG